MREAVQHNTINMLKTLGEIFFHVFLVLLGGSFLVTKLCISQASCHKVKGQTHLCATRAELSVDNEGCGAEV